MKNGKVAVIGLVGQSAFLSTDHFASAGETIQSNALFFEIGGKGYNQAIACARMGIDTVFIGAIGNDTNAKLCQDALSKEGIPGVFVEKDIPTAFAVITTDRCGENTVNVFPGAAKALSGEDLQKTEIRKILQECDYLLLQNELEEHCLAVAISMAKELNVSVIFNPAPASQAICKFLPDCKVITPNYEEAKLLLGICREQAVTEQELADGFRSLDVPCAIITNGAEGVIVACEGTAKHFPAYHHSETVDTTGAGDVFNGVLTALLASGERMEQAIKNAIVAAGISVTRHGAVSGIPYKEEVGSIKGITR